MKIIHITDAAAAGVLNSVTALARAQIESAEVSHVRFCYTPRAESPSHSLISEGFGPGIEVERWSSGKFGLFRGLRRELKRDDADLIHLHSSRSGFLGRALAAASGSRARVVYSPHGFAFDRRDYSPVMARAFLLLERLALRGSREIVVVSESEAELVRARLPKARAVVLPNTVDLTAFRPTPLSADASRLGVVHIGRIMAQKDPQTFAAIASRTEATNPGRFSFTWIGEGDRELLHTNGANIAVTGWADRARIRSHLSQASVLLFTSTGEGMPISLLEAQAMGLATVGADVVGVRDLVTDGVEGRLFTTVDEAVAALEAMLDRSVRSGAGAAARRRVERDHDQSDLGTRSLAAYRDLGVLSPK